MTQRKTKRQSAADQLVALARLFYGTGAKSEIPVQELTAAARRVGEKKEQRLAWAIEFAQEQAENMTRADYYNRQLEAAIFLNPELAYGLEQNKSVPYSPGLFFSEEHIRRVKEKFMEAIKAAATGAPYQFNVSQINVLTEKGALRYLINYPHDDKRYGDAMVEHAQLTLAQLIAEHADYIGFCDKKRHGCGKYFLKSRHDREFCSRTCLNRSTTNRQRGKEPAA